ncbi:MAG: DICT sensory domain-containing protein [Acidimicrobiia bacterium]
MSNTRADLTISAVASQTNLSIAALRSWELRYGFPVPHRTPSGHRRYTAHDVEQIGRVVRDRDAGMSLDAAISRTRASDAQVETSIFAGLRRRWPALPVHVLSKRAMLAVSRAIEDECCAQAERAVLIGSFQRQRFYRQSEARWRELARTASSATVFADFANDRRLHGAATEIALTDDAPLLREWAVVCDAPDAAACLAGIERPGSGDAHGVRRFEAVWSVDPAVVRDAAEIGLVLAGRDGAGAPAPAPLRSTPDPGAILRRATAVTNRIVAYLDT